MSQSYQSRIDSFPRFLLASYPSPLDRAFRLEESLRQEGCPSVPRIYLKRDDLLSFALGGNKIRNLEFLIGDALARGATDIITAGRQQSNHCRLTAAACARAGLRSHVVLSGAEPPRYAGNLLLDRLVGANIRFTGTEDRHAREEAVLDVASWIRGEGGVPYVIPVGGSGAIGAIGHILAADEIVRQCAQVGEAEYTVAVATATGGTQAGLVAGLRVFHPGSPVIGFAVAKSAEELQAQIHDVLRELAALLGTATTAGSGVAVDERALGAGYGEATAEAWRAIERLACTEGIVADPVYTGKGLAGVLSLVARGGFADSEAVVFVHTGGGPALFA